jgi:transposase-like protein
MESQSKPKTLQAAINHFSNEQTCIDTVALAKWPDGKPVCPKCGCEENYYLATQKRWKCKNGKCGKQFSVKVGTIFEDSPLPLEKWMLAMWMLANCKNGVSSWEIHRAISVTQKSAWFMLHRIRLAMQNGSIVKLGGGSGEVEADETFICGKARNMHKNVKARRITSPGKSAIDKVIVMGILERGGKVRPQVIPDRQKGTLQPILKEHVLAGAALFTDEMGGYKGLHSEYQHQIIDHAVRYVEGKVHTNGMENYWSLLKRGLNGTYISVEPFPPVPVSR